MGKGSEYWGSLKIPLTFCLFLIEGHKVMNEFVQ